MVVFNREDNNMSKKNSDKLGVISKVKQAVNDYVTVRKVRCQEVRDYFASEGESDPERLAAQKRRDQEFLRSLKKVGVGFIIFLSFYAFIKTVLGLW